VLGQKFFRLLEKHDNTTNTKYTKSLPLKKKKIAFKEEEDLIKRRSKK